MVPRSGEEMTIREISNVCPHCGGTGKRLVVTPRVSVRGDTPRVNERLTAEDDLFAAESSNDKTVNELAKLTQKRKGNDFDCK
jgi:hypothetical protein